MTRAEAPTVDSWVHLAQTRKPPLAATLFFVVAALGLAYAVVGVPGCLSGERRIESWVQDAVHFATTPIG